MRDVREVIRPHSDVIFEGGEAARSIGNQGSRHW